uniref:fimbrial protein n=1 Tax=Serratia proteamaculans TaxID=28151 RepID=UPI001F4C3AFE|nr:fimbrial protein [Serratia proteamaculans]ULG17713.1 fimbrial adhesin [Serratia proteamaculans]
MSKVFHLYLFLALLPTSSLGCTATPDFSPLEFDLGTVIVDGNKPIGSSLKTKWIDTDRSSLVECIGTIISRVTEPVSFTRIYSSSGPTTYYHTDVDGVAFGYSGYQQNSTGGGLQQFNLPSSELNLSISGPFYLVGGNMSLIKAASSVASGVIRAHIANVTYGESSISPSITRPIYLNAIIQASPCEIVNNAIQVDMPTTNTDDFSDSGPINQSETFYVNLRCASGTPINIQIDSASTLPNGIIRPDPIPYSAQGVGIQLLDTDEDPVVFGLPRYVGTSLTDGDYSIRFFARYYQIEQNVRAGNVQATASFTMTYQ